MWKKEYSKYYFSTEMTFEKIDKAHEIKEKNIPSSIFKYRAVNDYTLENLKNDAIWMSNPIDFNDPYDTTLTTRNPLKILDSTYNRNPEKVYPKEVTDILTDEDFEIIKRSRSPFGKMTDIAGKAFRVKKHELNVLKKIFRNVTQELVLEPINEMSKLFQKSCLVCSFSEVVDSIPMWSHYAEKHSGFCIEYDLTKVPLKNILIRCLHPVIYTDSRFDICKYLISAIKSKNNFNPFIGTISSLHKSPVWSYEKEWRLVEVYQPYDKSKNIGMIKPTAIYLGEKIIPKNEERLIKIAKKKEIKVYKMETVTSEYKMNFSQFELL